MASHLLGNTSGKWFNAKRKAGMLIQILVMPFLQGCYASIMRMCEQRAHVHDTIATTTSSRSRMATLMQKLSRANEKRLNFSQHLSRQLHRLVVCHSDALGVPPEFILYPLLTAVAACIGVNGSIEINPTWIEPSRS